MIAQRASVRQGALMAVMLLATLLFPRSIPLGIYGLGVSAGAGLALQAVAIVLVYRVNRIINFSQVAIGGVGALLFTASTTYRPLLRWFGFVCQGGTCDSPTAITVNYWISLAAALVVPVGLAGLVHVLVIKRFTHLPRLLLTVATVFVIPALAALGDPISRYSSTADQREELQLGADGRTAFPIDWSFKFGGAVFRITDILVVFLAAAAVGGLYLFLGRTSLGRSIRATAESPERAATLGINGDRVTLTVWLIAGGMSGVAGILTAMVSTRPVVATDLTSLLVLLTAAAMAGLTSLPITLVACVVLGATQQAALWAFGTPAPFLGALSVVLAVSFALQGQRASRGEIDLASRFSTAREIRSTPAELRSLPTVRTWRRALAIGGVVVFVIAPVLLTPAQVDAGTTVLIFAMVGTSLIVLTGWAGQMSLGQVGLAGVGGWVAAMTDLPFPIAPLLGGLAGAVAAILIGYPALRLRGLHLAIISLALAVSINQLLLEPRYGGTGLPRTFARPKIFTIDFESTRVFYYLVLAVLVGVLLAVAGLRRSRTARALLACRDNELAAQSLGINLVRARLLAFTISGGVAGVAGAMLAYQQHAVRQLTFLPDTGLLVFQNAVVGGLGFIGGAVLGGVLLQGTAIFSLPDLLTTLLIGPGALAIVLMLPGGIGQWLFELRDGLLRRVAKREGIIVPSLQGPMTDADDEVAPLLPKSARAGGESFLPVRYRLKGQWALTQAARTEPDGAAP